MFCNLSHLSNRGGNKIEHGTWTTLSIYRVSHKRSKNFNELWKYVKDLGLIEMGKSLLKSWEGC